MLIAPDYLLWEDKLRSDLLLEVSQQGVVVGARAKAGASATHTLQGRVLLPGLVNAHSHAFQRLIRGRTEYVAAGALADDFWSWREHMYRAAQALTPEDLYITSKQVFIEMARAGITAVGEFHYLHHQADGTPYDDRSELAKQVVRAARDVGLRICLLRVAYARAGHQRPANPQQRRFIDPSAEDALKAVDELRFALRNDDLVNVGIAPHSVRAVPVTWLKAFAQLKDLPFHMHVAEQPAEISACVAEHNKRPVELIDSVGLLRPNFTAVHGIHVDQDEIVRMGRAKAMVCACPSTERNLGDGIVPADALLKGGVAISLGSDSQAHVDLLLEARQLDGHMRLLRLKRAVLDPGGGDPNGLALRLLKMASENGARSIGLNTGALKPGAPADFFTLDLNHPTLLGIAESSVLAGALFCADRSAVREVAVNGRFIVEDGVHKLEAETARQYREVAKRVLA